MVERVRTMARTVRVGELKEPSWRIAMARWVRSGLSVRAFCRAEGLSEPAFYSWRQELQRRKQLRTSSVGDFLSCSSLPT